MDIISFSYDKALIPPQQLQAIKNGGTPALKRIGQPVVDPEITQLIQNKKQLKPALMIVVGIGGSNLGTQAIYEAIFGKEGSPQFPLYFADTVDSDYIAILLKRTEYCLQHNHAVLITVISKSGTTTETIANFECFLLLLKKYHPKNYQQYIVAITDKDSSLWHYAQQASIDRLEIPKEIGGRYSVFTAVGLFPLAMAGVDIAALMQGAQIMMDQATMEPVLRHDNGNQWLGDPAISASYYCVSL